MSNPSINFKVGDDGVSSFMDKLKAKSDSITSQFIKDAQIQTASAKEQLKLLEEKIKSLQRISILERQIAEAMSKDNTQRRLGGIESRGHVLDSLYEQNKAAFKDVRSRYQSGTITKEEYDVEYAKLSSRRSRIHRLGDANTEDVIKKQGDLHLKEVRENERTNQILAAYMRENINTIRQTSQQQVGAIKAGDEKIVDSVSDAASPQEKLVNQLTNQQIKEERKDQDEKGGKLRGLYNFANALAVDRVGGMIASMPSANNELDYIKPMLSTVGLVLGGLPGMLADMATGTSLFGFSLGQSQFGMMGMQLGSKMGEFAGDALSRTYRSRDELQTSNFRLKAMGFGGVMNKFGASYKSKGDNSSYQLGGTGMFDDLNQDYSAYGMDMKSVSKLQAEIAMRQGRFVGISRTTDSVVGAKGVGVNEQTSFALIELLRSNKESDKNLSNIIGGVLGKGTGTIFKEGDRAFLNEFLTRNYVQLQKTLLQTQGSVPSGLSMSILSKFEGLGGQFSARDPRSTGLIGGIQNALANPGSESMKALMFTLMRRDHPEMDLAETQLEMQKGMGSPRQLQSLLKFIVSQGGSRGYKMNQIAGALGLEGNLSAASQILGGYEKFGDSFDMSKLVASGQFSSGAMLGLAKEQTSPFSASSAEIENEFIKSSVLGIQMVGSKMKGLMGDMLDGLQEYIEKRVKEMMTGSKENPPQTPRQKMKQKIEFGDFGPKF